MGRPQAERGHVAKRSPTAALDAPDTYPGDHENGRTRAGLHAQFPYRGMSGSCHGR